MALTHVGVELRTGDHDRDRPLPARGGPATLVRPERAALEPEVQLSLTHSRWPVVALAWAVQRALEELLDHRAPQVVVGAVTLAVTPGAPTHGSERGAVGVSAGWPCSRRVPHSDVLATNKESAAVGEVAPWRRGERRGEPHSDSTLACTKGTRAARATARSMGITGREVTVPQLNTVIRVLTYCTVTMRMRWQRSETCLV